MSINLSKKVIFTLLCASMAYSVVGKAATVETGSSYLSYSADTNVTVIGSTNNYGSISDKPKVWIRSVGINGTGINCGNGDFNIIFSGDPLDVWGHGTVASGSDLGFDAINNSGKLTFNNELGLSIEGLGGVRNDGVLTFNNYVDILPVVSSGGSELIKIVNNGIMNVNKGYSFGEFSRTFQIENNGVLVINSTDIASYQGIGGNIVHAPGANTSIEMGGTTDSIARITSNIKGSTNGNFSLVLKDNSLWSPSTQEEEVAGVVLNGGSIIAPRSGYLDASNNWVNVYGNLTLRDFRSNGNFNQDNGIRVYTDLVNNTGSKVTFTGTTENVTVPLLIINEDDNNGIPIKPSDGKSVTVAELSETSAMKLKIDKLYLPASAWDAYKLATPIIDEISQGGIKKFNFVGWSFEDADRDLTTPAESERSILVEDIDATHRRLNDLRTDPSEVGVWIRGEKGDTKIRNYSYSYDLMTGGYDWHKENDAADMFMGFGISRTTNDCDDNVVGDTKSMGYNIYGSWLGKDNNDYVDVIIKYGTLDKDYAGFDRNNVFVSGDYDKKLFAISTKYGRRYFQKNGFYYEPSVGFTYGRVGSADYVDNQNTHIHADSTNSEIASLGIQVGKNIKGTEYYSKIELMHDFDGKINVSAPGIRETDDMGGTWVKFAVGTSRKIDKNSSFYIDVEKDFGNKVKKPYSFSLGYRHTW